VIAQRVIHGVTLWSQPKPTAAKPNEIPQQPSEKRERCKASATRQSKVASARPEPVLRFAR
jgi:hypothetical protein